MLSYIEVISGTGAVCQPVGTAVYLFGVKCTCVCRILGEGLPAQGQQEHCQLAVSAQPAGFGILCICSLMSSPLQSRLQSQK